MVLSKAVKVASLESSESNLPARPFSARSEGHSVLYLPGLLLHSEAGVEALNEFEAERKAKSCSKSCEGNLKQTF